MLRRLSLVVGLVVCVWALGSSTAQAQSGQSWCSVHPTLNTCVVSASLDGTPIDANDPNYDVFALRLNTGGAKTVQWTIQPTGPGDLSAEVGQTFSLTIDTNVVPREMDGFGAGVTYTRTNLGSGKWEVVITGQPVSVTDQNGCTFPSTGPVCTPVAPGPSKVYFQGEIDDYNYTAYTTDPSLPGGFVDSFWGMDMYTNVAETSLPPSLIEVNGVPELQIELTDHHYEHDGTTLVRGNFYLRMPAQFLNAYWGIDDPSTLASTGLAASVGAGGGTLSVTVEPGNTGVQVQISNLTFSRRNLKIRLGLVTPHAPTNVHATRLTGTTARATFVNAKPRGQRVTGYGAFCHTATKSYRFKTIGRHSPVTIEGLTPHVAYTCTLRARSRAGWGNRSKAFSIHR